MCSAFDTALYDHAAKYADLSLYADLDSYLIYPDIPITSGVIFAGPHALVSVMYSRKAADPTLLPTSGVLTPTDASLPTSGHKLERFRWPHQLVSSLPFTAV